MFTRIRGTRFIVGGKHSFQHSYGGIVGKECSYWEPRDSSTSYVMTDGGNGMWYVHNEDLLPTNYNNNSEAAAILLRKNV